MVGWPSRPRYCLGGREADEDAAVDLGGERGRGEDAGDVEPHAAEPDPLAGEDAVDAEQLRRLGAEHADRLGRGRGVEVAAAGDGRADDREQVEGRCLDAERVGVDRRDQRAAVDVRVRRAGVGDLGDRADAADHPRGGERQLGGAAESVWPVVTVSRLVPSWSISASSPACEEEERPSTATIAATPIAIPSAERPARSAAGAHADAGDPREVAGAQLLGVERRRSRSLDCRPAG